MSRSRRKNPYAKICCDSSAADKKVANRRFRHACNRLNPLDDPVYPEIDELHDTWGWASDGEAKGELLPDRKHDRK